MDNGDKLRKLLEHSDYNIIQVNGQRIYSLMSNTDKKVLPKGSEIFVGKLPLDMFEDELVPLFASVAPIYELRLMVDFFGRNRGYCFVRYFTRESAERAIVVFDNYQVRNGCRIGVYKSLDNTRLFVGGIPQDKTKNEIREALECHLDDIRDVIMYPAYNETAQNRGYAFLEFDDHRAAAIARRQLPPGSFFLWGVPIKVDWAEPLPEPDPRIMSKVTTLYVRDIPTAIHKEQFKSLIYDVINPDLITKVHKTLDYAFVHFVNRCAAEESKAILKYFKINDRSLEVTWARPELYSKKFNKHSVPAHYCLSLPAKTRWLIKKKTLFRPSSDVSSSDYDEFSSRNSPLFIFRRNVQDEQQYDEARPSDYQCFYD